MLILILFLSLNSVSAFDNSTKSLDTIETNSTTSDILTNTQNDIFSDSSTNLENNIKVSKDGDTILINPGTYKIHNIQLTKSITLQGKGNPRDIVIDGEERSSIFLISNPNVHVTFKNITFINGLTNNFGGAICINTGGAVVDNCIFINNTALDDTNAGGISNYGNEKNRGYLLVNNSLFINNHADHDGGAITTCYADSYIYNCVFINNSAHRDGGAIRVSVFGYGDVQDCIFMFNHADEWGGAYYSWSGESNIERCIFMNNTAGTNGGAVMVSGNINLQDSIIVNNKGGETGGSFYIQNPMYNAKTVINIHNNLITNNSSPYGKEIYIHWEHDYAYNLYTQFDNNDWGDENPNDSSVIDPDDTTPRSKVKSVIKSNLFNDLNLNLLNRYNDLIKDFFPGNSLDNLKNQFPNTEKYNPEANKNSYQDQNNNKQVNVKEKLEKTDSEIINRNIINSTTNAQSQRTKELPSKNNLVTGNSTVYGEDEKAYELNKTGGSVAKQANIDYKFFIVAVLVLILLAIGYIRHKRMSK